MPKSGQTFMKFKKGGVLKIKHPRRLARAVGAQEQAAWWDAAAKYHRNPKSFVAAYQYVNLHPIFWRFEGPALQNLNVEQVADPKDLEKKASIVRGRGFLCVEMYVDKRGVFLEAGPWLWASEWADPATRWACPLVGMSSHDIALDTAGKSFEEAVVKLAKKIQRNYGDNRDTVTY